MNWPSTFGLWSWAWVDRDLELMRKAPNCWSSDCHCADLEQPWRELRRALVMLCLRDAIIHKRLFTSRTLSGPEGYWVGRGAGSGVEVRSARRWVSLGLSGASAGPARAMVNQVRTPGPVCASWAVPRRNNSQEDFSTRQAEMGAWTTHACFPLEHRTHLAWAPVTYLPLHACGPDRGTIPAGRQIRRDARQSNGTFFPGLEAWQPTSHGTRELKAQTAEL